MRIENPGRYIMPTPGPAGRRRFLRAAAAALALCVTGLSGCGSIKPVRYYQLTHPPVTSSGSQAPLDVLILVRLFQTSHLYREDRIVYGAEKVQLGLYENDRWTEPPVDLLQDALARGLRSSGSFRAVTTLRSEANVDYYLTGQLYAFREVSANDSIVARLNYDVELMDLKKGKVIWRHTYSHDEPSTGKTVGDVVMAMDKNVQRSVQEVQDGILQALANYIPKK
jgi:ABC-type uncharacterized transport system auxiliary subunit